MSYDTWKLRSDLDENPPEEVEENDEAGENIDDLYECRICEGREGQHTEGCPDRPSYGDWVDAEIDRLEEGS